VLLQVGPFYHFELDLQVLAMEDLKLKGCHLRERFKFLNSAK
jgi:hypothetical protein